MGSESSPNLPILNFSDPELKPGTDSWSVTSRKVTQALEQYGCFVIEYDKFPLQLHNKVFSLMEELFHLPTETKMKNRYEKPLNGYVGQIPKIPLHESLGIDNATSLEGTQFFTKLMWPQGNDIFCEYICKYAKVAAELDRMVTRMIFESYGVEKYHDAYIDTITCLLRLLKNRAPRPDETNLGFITHTDKSFTTILHQNQINALEVETRDGNRINVDYSSPSSFVVIAGDALMAWSNDRILSPRHQVVMSGNIDRYSLGLFAFNNGTLEVPEELVDDQHPLKYKPFDHLGLLRFYRTDEGYTSKCPIKAYCGV
ncbi:putative 2-oxoglutarate-dependent dioxygenase AOP1.2-like [Hibiscus syriacus]|uniref:2-oxoglutarate-dependent dioxygenase AOP1.2-like n=1 Tax=Hibiscus syriacus TaxID=106335 RepID=A0A6A2ZVS7_HIBSY|nr:2-oxoglutarate-dependent dioxygenase AOP3-like [Hibiscus syriacus]KAE8696101.1 putative 2-oxoglutarate-dependent dioxygenase AOP1.2-like [Hibiscus syriacus]